MDHAFPCGNVALDFVGTLKARRNPAPLETLTSPNRLDSWLREAGVVDHSPDSDAADLTVALELREAIYALVAARFAKSAYPEGAMNVLNQAARSAPVVPQLTASGLSLDGNATQGLSTVARVAIDILSGSDAELLKECGRPECTQVYLDRSRGSRREWCAMETCGNKMKAAAYRARKRGNPPLTPARGPR